MLSTGAMAEEIPYAEADIRMETEAVPETAVPKMEITQEEQTPAPAVYETEAVPSPQEQVSVQPGTEQPAIPEPAPETEARVETLTAVSDDGAVEASAVRKDGSGYTASESIRIAEKDGAAERFALEQFLSDLYILSHQDIEWTETNITALKNAVSDSVKSFSVYRIVDGAGVPLSMQENSVVIRVTDPEALSWRNGESTIRVYIPDGMTEDTASTQSVNSGDFSFTAPADSFALAVLGDIEFTPEIQAENNTEQVSETEPETAQAEAETAETENTENREEAETEPPAAETEAPEAQTETTEPETEGTAPQGETDAPEPQEQQEGTETEIPAEEASLPVHPETVYFADDTVETYPVESIDGPSPLAADTGLPEEGIPAGGSYTGETTASEFSGLSNTEAAEKCLELVRRVDNSGIIPSVVTAQMILESGYVRTGLAQNANNCFGMKSSLSQNEWTSTWEGQSVNYQTWEQSPNGAISTPICSFRVYDSIEQSILDHSGYLLEAKNNGALRYPGITESRDYTTVANIIKAGGYATDINYVAKLCNIIRTYNLDRYDADARGGNSHTEGETASSEMR